MAFTDLVQIEDLLTEDSVEIEAGFDVSEAISEGVIEGLTQVFTLMKEEFADVFV